MRSNQNQKFVDMPLNFHEKKFGNAFVYCLVLPIVISPESFSSYEVDQCLDIIQKPITVMFESADGNVVLWYQFVNFKV